MKKLGNFTLWILTILFVVCGFLFIGDLNYLALFLTLFGISLCPLVWRRIRRRIDVRTPVRIFLSMLLLLAAAFSPLGDADDLNLTMIETAADETAVASTITNQIPDLTATKSSDDIDTLTVHFIDVGQGDSTLITCGGSAMLIDAADDTKGTAIQNYLQKQGVKTLDYLILTHPDADHIGGAPVIITKFAIDKAFVSNFEKDNRTYEKLIQALDNRRVKYSTPKVGSTYRLGSAEFTIIAPNQAYEDPNDASVGILLKNGENSFIFTGDAEETAESDIISNGIDIKADVYQVGHHGSNTSSSGKFLDAVQPEFAVISCGEGNSYGHPRVETLNNFRAMGIKVYRTDEQGTIVAESDGKNITWNSSPSETWQAGEPVGSSSKKAKQPAETVIQETKTPVTEAQPVSTTYILNTKTKKFHHSWCGNLPTSNRKDTDMSRDEMISSGYSPCKKCNP